MPRWSEFPTVTTIDLTDKFTLLDSSGPSNKTILASDVFATLPFRFAHTYGDQSLTQATLQSAADAVEAAGGGVVVVQGTWTLNSQVSLGSNVHLLFAVGAVINRNWSVSVPVSQASKYTGAMFRQKSTSAGSPNTTISITGPGLIDANGFDGPILAFYFVEDLTLADFFVDFTGCGDWCVTLSGKRIGVDNLTLRGGGAVFEDGIHILYGEHYRVSNCHVESGDDMIALTTSAADAIRHVAISNMTGTAQNGMQLKLDVGAAATGGIEHVTYSNGTGQTGVVENGGIMLVNATANRQLLRHVVIDGATCRMGTGGSVNRRGVYIDTAYNISVNNVTMVEAVFEQLYVNDCDEVRVSASSFIASAASTTPVARVLGCGSVYIDTCFLDATNTTGVPVRFINTSYLALRGCFMKAVASNTQAILPESGNGTLLVSGCRSTSAGAASHGVRCNSTGITRLVFGVNDFQVGTGQVIFNDANLPASMDVTSQGFTAITFAASIQPSLWASQVGKVTLTANISITNPFVNPPGARQRFIFTQNATGGWTHTFGSAYKVAWTPDTAANKTNVIEFVCDGTNWWQSCVATGL